MYQISRISMPVSAKDKEDKRFSPFKYQQSTSVEHNSARTVDCKSSFSKTSFLNHNLQKIQKIEKAQEYMQRMFQNCITNLMSQIEQKQRLNNQLLKQVNGLKENLLDTGKDIQTISNYLRKNAQIKSATSSNKKTDKSQDLKEKFSSLSKINNVQSQKALCIKLMKMK